MQTSEELNTQFQCDADECFPLIFFARVTMHADDRSILTSRSVPLVGARGEAQLIVGEGEWTVRWQLQESGCTDFGDLDVTFAITRGQSRATSVGVELCPATWGTDRYVAMPGAVYAGNRFESRKQPYPPMFDGRDAIVNVPILISDVPRLNHQADEPSQVVLPSHDLATPAVGVFDPTNKSGLWVLTQQRTRLGPYGMGIRESPDRTSATISVTAPCVREGRRDWATWSDRAPDWDANAANRLITMCVRLARFECENVIRLFERLATLRTSMVPAAHEFSCAPLSACAAVLEAKFDAVNWCESVGCYATKEPEIDWQVGWVNGLVTSYGMLVCGGARARNRALRTLDFALCSQTASGLLPGYFRSNGGWIGDGFQRVGTEHWAMVRKQADALFFGVKHLILLEARGDASRCRPEWRASLGCLADALVKIWNKHREFGQFVHIHTGELVVGNSTAGALVPAGLALAGVYLKRPALVDIAVASGAALFNRWTTRGVTVGGPGEILATPDSESAMALLESFVTLYDVTHDRAWLPKAVAAADQLASWVVSYPFEFPPESTLGRLRANATGTVIANAQNKHSAPGLCTFSGDALFRLFRGTGIPRHLDLLRDIAGTMPQYLSRADRIVGTSPAGVICERVNLSDWEGDHRVGDVPPWPCWCESALLLTCAEVPGVYVQPDAGYVLAMDNIQTLTLEETSTRLTVLLLNRTPLVARVNVFIEQSDDARSTPFDEALRLSRTRTVTVPAGGMTSVSFPKISEPPQRDARLLRR